MAPESVLRPAAKKYSWSASGCGEALTSGGAGPGGGPRAGAEQIDRAVQLF